MIVLCARDPVKIAVPRRNEYLFDLRKNREFAHLMTYRGFASRSSRLWARARSRLYTTRERTDTRTLTERWRNVPGRLILSLSDFCEWGLACEDVHNTARSALRTSKDLDILHTRMYVCAKPRCLYIFKRQMLIDNKTTSFAMCFL